MINLKNKKTMMMLGGAVLAIALVVGGVFAIKNFLSPQDDTSGTSKKKKVSLPTNIIEVSDRPYLVIKPLADGRNLEISIMDLKKNAEEMLLYLDRILPRQ